MKGKLIGLTSILALTLGMATSANATLINRGGGMIYDSAQDLTWLQDANYGAGSSYDNGGSSIDGRMTWNNAVAWAASLTVGGFGDWRLPTIVDSGTAGCNFAYTGTDCGYNVDTSGSELAKMWYDILGNKAYFDTSGSGPQSGWGLTNTGPFTNLQSYVYWSGTEYAPGTSRAWGFLTASGGQLNGTKLNEFYAWAVRSGDVAAVPEPGTLMLLAAGLAGIAGATKRRRC